MGRGVKVFLGSVLAIAGVVIALTPFVSVWRVAGEALDELPEIAQVESSGTSHGLGALSDDEFVLASRSYEQVTSAAVGEALLDNGFEATTIGGSPVYVKECCGEYDALWVEVAEADGDGVVRASATAADADVQLTAGVLAVFGLVLLVTGGLLVASGRRAPVASRDRALATSDA